MADAGDPPADEFDEVDDRFAELILAEFGERSAQEASAPAPSESGPGQPPTRRAGREPSNEDAAPATSSDSPSSVPEVPDRHDGLPQVFSLDEAWDRVEPDEPDTYTPEDLPPLKPPSSAVIVALVLLIGGLTVGLVLGTREQLAGVSAGLVTISVLAGLGLLMSLAVRRRGPEDPDDDGARL